MRMIKERFQHFNISLGFKGQNSAKEKLEYFRRKDFHFFNDRFAQRKPNLTWRLGLDKQFAASGRDFSMD